MLNIKNLGNNSENFNMLDYSVIVTIIFQILYSFLFIFIMINKFLIIVKNEFIDYEEKNEEKNDEKNEKFENLKTKISLEYDEYFISKIKKFFIIKIYYNFLKFFNRMKYLRKMEKKKLFDREIESETMVYQNIEFDISYSEVIKQTEVNIESKYIVDSEKDKIAKNLKRKETVLVWNFIGNALVLVTIILIYASLYKISDNHVLFSSLNRKFNNLKTVDNRKNELTLLKVLIINIIS